MAFLHKVSDSNRECSLKPNYSARSLKQWKIFFLPAVRCMITCYDGDSSIPETLKYRKSVLTRPERRIHLCISALRQKCILCKRKMVWRYFCNYLCAHLLRHSEKMHRCCCTHMLNDCSTSRVKCQHTVPCNKSILGHIRASFNAKLS